MKTILKNLTIGIALFTVAILAILVITVHFYHTDDNLTLKANILSGSHSTRLDPGYEVLSVSDSTELVAEYSQFNKISKPSDIRYSDLSDPKQLCTALSGYNNSDVLYKLCRQYDNLHPPYHLYVKDTNGDILIFTTRPPRPGIESDVFKLYEAKGGILFAFTDCSTRQIIYNNIDPSAYINMHETIMHEVLHAAVCNSTQDYWNSPAKRGPVHPGYDRIANFEIDLFKMNPDLLEYEFKK